MSIATLRVLADRRYLPLVLLLGLAVVLTAIAAASAVEGESAWLAPEAAQRASAGGEIVLVDVRSPREWRETGLPEHARPITIHDPAGIEGFGEKVLAAVDGDRERPIALICARGYRSARARDYLASIGFTRLLDVREGMLGRDGAPGWLERGLPLRSCANC
ncbi:MAG: rhodanese-like domain-containing protein [Rhodospirillaceae bacterium]|nr:rhodanese-like domain-containing protein [Rhodospirillaceae bacterium]